MKYQCVGGPLDGKELEASAGRVLVPRATSRVTVDPDGYATPVFDMEEYRVEDGKLVYVGREIEG